MFTRVFVSTLSAGAILLGAVTPGFAYVYNNLPRTNEGGVIEQTMTPQNVLGYPYPGSSVYHHRYMTHPDAERSANIFNPPRVGYIKQYGGDRQPAMDQVDGRSNLPLRAYMRYPTQRNNNRSILGRMVRSGDWRVLNTDGDMRRRPIGATQMMLLPTQYERFLSNSPESSLPPVLVQTGNDQSPYMIDKPTRRDIRDNYYWGETLNRDRDILNEIDTKTR